MLTLKWIKTLLLTGVEECSALAGVSILVFSFFLARVEIWCAASEDPSAKLTAGYVRAVLLGVIIKQEV